MKESIAVEKLIEIPQDTVDTFLNLTNTIKLYPINRAYLFNSMGYNLDRPYFLNNKFKESIEKIENLILSCPKTSSMKIVERGLGISKLNLINVPRAKNYLLLDNISRQVRIPLQGQSSLNGIELENGTAYIVDNVSGLNFIAKFKPIQLVFNLLSISESKKIWELYKRVD